MESDEKLIENKNYINEVIDRMGYGKYQIFMMIIISNASISLGINFSLVNILPFILSHTRTLSIFEISLLPISYMIGVLAGYFVMLFYGDSVGRLKIIDISNVGFIISGFLTGFFDDIYILAFLRLLNGVFTVILTGLLCTYLAECCPSKYRGTVSMLFWFIIAIGEILFVLGCLWLLPNFDNDKWKILAFLSIVPAIIFMVFSVVFFKESPLYLGRNNQHEMAIEVLNSIAGTNSKELCKEEEIRSIYTMEATVEGTVLSRFKQIVRKSLIKKHSMMIFIWTFVVSNYYGIYLTFPYFLEKMNVKADLIQIMLLCYSSQIPVTFLFSFTIEIKKIGRVWSLIFSLVLVIVFSFLLTLDLNRYLMYFSISMVYGFSDGNFVLLYAYTPEIYNTEIRVASLSFVNIVSRLLYSFCPYIFLHFLSIDQNLVYYFIMISSLLAIFLILTLRIETIDKVLDTFTN